MKLINGDTFVNDEKVIGKWKLINKINSLDEFYKNLDNIAFKNIEGEIYFLPNGEGYWIYEGWSKGYILYYLGADEPILKYKYELKDIGQNSYLFLFVKNNYEEIIEIYKKVSSAHFKISDFKIEEDIDIPFINDENVIGKWKSVGYVENVEDFSINENYEDYLWLKSIDFKPNGEVIRKYFTDTTNWQDKWTKGLLLDQVKKVASKYIIKKINNEDYMFMEWKMGNYIYAKQKPWHYVFKRDN